MNIVNKLNIDTKEVKETNSLKVLINEINNKKIKLDEPQKSLSCFYNTKKSK